MTEREEFLANRFSKIIQKETVSSFSDTDLTKFYAFHDLLREEFPTLFQVCEAEDFSGSLLLRWKGKTKKDPILFMNHFDVVEGEGNWKYPPFSGTIEDGKIWGRGTLDTKSGLFCMLQAAEELMQSGYTPERDIYFESACTEECTGLGADTISRELQKRGLHFYYTLDEGGMMIYDPIGGADGVFAMIGVGEKGCANIRFVARSAGGHASTPKKNTPIVRLSKFVTAAEKSHVFQKKLNETTREMFRRTSTKMKGALRFVLGHPDFFAPLLTAVLPLVSDTAAAMMKTTLAFTQSGGSESFNSMPVEAWVGADMRYSHHQGEKSIDAVRKIAEKYGVETEIVDPAFPSLVSDYRGESFGKIEKAVKKIFPDVIPSPYITNTASDSRYMNRISENCFRFTPFFISEEQLESIHSVDENIDVSCLPKAVEFYKTLLEDC